VELLTYVTCPTMRYHPAVVAQKAATMGLLSNGRFTLGLGSGENLNEHVIGQGWPAVAVRQEMLEEAVAIIRRLLDGEQLTVQGDYFRVDQAQLWDRPDQPVEIGVAVGGEEAVRRFAPLADHLIATEPSAELVSGWRAARKGAGPGTSRAIGQVPICWGPDKQSAVDRAHELFRWFGGGWKVNSELPGPAAFDAAAQYVRPEDVAESIPCGSDVGAVIDAVKPPLEAGFTHLPLVQIGGEHQSEFLEWSQRELLPALRELG
jgi:G6PDH family F420-dependent oxidoreductase